jgi:hypothetical protein
MRNGDELVHKYRIEKQRIAVTLRMIGGDEIHGHIFVPPRPYGYGAPEEPIHLFNAPEPFLPLVQGDGEVLLVAKDRVVEVAGITAHDDDAVRRESARQALLEITLADGVVHLGSMRLETPSDRPRLQDFLNHHPGRFATLYTTEGVRLINVRLIDRVRPLD